MAQKSPQPDSFLPLPAATFHILMAVAEEDRHGYGIIQDVAARTGGQLKAETMDSYSALLKELLPANAVRLYHSNDQISDWLKCMRTRALPICDVEIGQRSATVCNLVNQVYFNRKGCKWDPKTEQFTDGTGDASWLTREYRAPWKPV